MHWTPILEGPLATTATEAIHDIALELATTPSPLVAPADRMLFWAYTTRLVDEPFAHAAYDEAMDDVIAMLRHGVGHPSLYGGLAGIGFALEHVLDHGIDDVLEVIDEALLGVLDVDDWTESIDLASGLVGYGVYFLERIATNPDAALAREGLGRVIAHLERAALRGDLGATWSCRGVARGVPGLIAFLERTVRAANDNRAGSLCEAALRWLSARRRETVASPIASVHAWCEGDPGTAAALWRIAPALARDTARACARRAEAAKPRDAGLCHGTAGLAHLFNRFYQASGDPLFADAARSWFARTLAMRRTDVPNVAGFATWRAHAWQPAHDLLEGVIGIALALLAAVAPTEPAWDRLLLADLPLASSV